LNFKCQIWPIIAFYDTTLPETDVPLPHSIAMGQFEVADYVPHLSFSKFGREVGQIRVSKFVKLARPPSPAILKNACARTVMNLIKSIRGR